MDYKNTSKQQLFEKNDISIKNNGAKIPLPNRKLALAQLLSLRVSDLEDLPKQMSSLFSGNSSKRRHLLFDDVASSFDETSFPTYFIINSIKSRSVVKRKQDRTFTLEQENFGEKIMLLRHTQPVDAFALGVKRLPKTSDIPKNILKQIKKD